MEGWQKLKDRYKQQWRRIQADTKFREAEAAGDFHKAKARADELVTPHLPPKLAKQQRQARRLVNDFNKKLSES